jgi:hypothetical protein
MASIGSVSLADGIEQYTTGIKGPEVNQKDPALVFLVD